MTGRPTTRAEPPAEVLLLVGTRKGLFLLQSEGGRTGWRLEGPFLEGYEVYHAVPDARRPGRCWAAVNHPVWGSHVFRSEDGGRSWRPTGGRIGFPSDSGRELQALWHVEARDRSRPDRIHVGVEPAALFRSEDGGESWTWLSSLDRHPTRATWQPAKGGLFLHSIQVDPAEPDRLYAAVSAGGCYRSDDDGASWTPVNRGVRAGYLPNPAAASGHNPHAIRLHPARPDRLYRQAYDGVYRSDDRGESWREVTEGLPSGFGYVIGLDPARPDRCWVVPEESSHMRCVCEGRLRVYETADAGNSWTGLTEGLPQEHAYVSVLREAFCTDGLEPCGTYLGTSTGHLFVSGDGRRWSLAAGFLPTILSVSCRSGPPTGRPAG